MTIRATIAALAIISSFIATIHAIDGRHPSQVARVQAFTKQ